MMPPPHLSNNNKNRVENIKKKFEDINKIVPVPDNLNNSRSSTPLKSRCGRSEDPSNSETRSKSDASKKQRLAVESKSSTDLFNNNHTPQKINNGGHPLLERQLSSPTSRGHIKRSPAFRCDRIVKGKNVVTPSIGLVAERPRSVVDKRVKQFDSSAIDLLSAKACNTVSPDERVPSNGSQILLGNNIAERGRAFTLASGNCNRPSKVPFNSDHGEPGNAKRNKLGGGKDIAFPLRDSCAIHSSGSWLHNRLGNEQKECEEEISQDPARIKTLLAEIQLKKISNGFDAVNTGSDKKRILSEVNTSSPASLPPKISKPWTSSSSTDVEIKPPRLTDTLKAALKAPLPPGPPPKKPPRTFAHNSPVVPSSSEKSHHRNSSAISKSSVNSPCHISVSPQTIIKPIRSKTESQIMLRKLESALMNRKTVDTESSPVRSAEEPCRKGSFSPSGSVTSNLNQSVSVSSNPNVPVTPSHAARSGCLSSLKCAVGPIKSSQSSGDYVHEKSPGQLDIVVDPKRKSSLQDTSLTGRQKLQGYLHKSHSVEHIYAEPFQFIGDGTQICKSKDCEANFRHPPSSRELTRQKFHSKRILSTSPEQIFRTRMASPNDCNSEGLHYLCTPIQENSPLSAGELQMTSLPLRLSPPPVEATNPEIFRRPSRECLSLEMPHSIATHSSKIALKRSSAEKDKASKDMTDSNLNSTKIKFLMNQAFGSPLQCLPATPLENNSDSDSIVSTPDEGAPAAPLLGAPSPPNPMRGKEITRPTCPPPDVPEIVPPSKESLQQLTAERRIYVRRVSSHVMGQKSLRLSTQSSTNNRNSSNHLFECLLLVGLNLDPDRPKCKVPYVKSQFPPEAVVPAHIESLCFPDAGEWPPPLITTSGNDAISGEEQCYSLVITSDTGDRKYGYCRRVQPEGAPICLPLAYCILTPHRASGFYFKVLAELETRHGEPEMHQTEFVQQLYDCAFPAPGQCLRVNDIGQQLSVGCTGTSSSSSSSGCGSGSRGTVELRRHSDSRLDERDLSTLFNSLQIHVFLQVFSSLLLERKVLLLSQSISKLSACVDALQSILFPFVWQHTFIPVLPSSMLDICQAPTPYIIGVLKGRHSTLPPVSIDHGIVVDVDNSIILQSQQDETTILPVGISRALKMALQLAQNSTKPFHSSRNVLVSEAFLRTFVEVCGHYQTHIVTQQDGKKLFERESFVKAVRSRSVQMFLEWFTETAMFSAFIESRLEKPDVKGVFEQRVSEHHEEREKNTLLYLKNYKGLNKKVKTLGDRFKDWAPFS